MEYRILGPFYVAKNGAEVAVGGGKQRALLALLLLRANQAVSTDRLIDQLWGKTPSASATKIVQNYVSKLRRVLGDGVLLTRGHGYELRVEPRELDADCFNEAVAAGRRTLAAGDAARASATLTAALALWHGPPLSDFAYEEFAREDIERLDELRVAALIDRIEADLQLGRHETLISEVETLVAQNPLQERLRGQLMLALYRSGRQVEALQVYQATRQALLEQLGIEPGESLRRLERAILNHEPTIDEPAPRHPLVASTSRPKKWRNSQLVAAGLGAVAVSAAVALAAWGGESAKPLIVAGNAVAIIDPASNRVTGQVHVGTAPEALALRGGGLWVANVDDQSVSHVDVASRKVIRNIPVGGLPLSLAVGRNAVLIVRRRADGLPEIAKIDPRYDVVAPGPRMQGEPDGEAGIAVGRHGIWVVAEAGLLERLDPTGTTVTASVPTGNTAAAVAVGADAVWAVDRRGDNVARVDPTTRVVVATTNVGRGPDAVATGAGGVWIVDTLDDEVKRIDPTTNSVKTTIPVGRSPTGIAVGPGSVWVANSRDGTVSRIDPALNKVVKTITVGGSPRAIAIGDGRVWVSVQNPLVDPDRKRGGVARVDATGERNHGIDSLDPALAYTAGSWSIEYATCAKLLNYPDSPAPTGSRLEPEVATEVPVPSADGKSYEFTIRPGFRFSPPSNDPVTAQTFKFTIERALSKKVDGPARSFDIDIVGLRAYEAGNARHISGVRAHGNTLTIQLTRVAPVILSQLAMPFFCAVPPGTPANRKGVNKVPAAGPYYVASYATAQGALLTRNPNYRGSRPHRLDEIDYRVDIGRAQSVKEVENGRADFAADGLPPEQVARLSARYGPGSPAARAGGQRYFPNPGLDVAYLAMNTSRPLFADARLRKAVNYALDRRAIAQASQAGGYPAQPTDQYLPPGMSGFRDIHAYPLTPDLPRAKQLARGHRGHALLYTCAKAHCRRIAQLIKSELAPLGISVDIKPFRIRLWAKHTGTRGAPFDLAYTDWSADYADPANFLNYFFDGRSIHATGNGNISYFDDPAYNRRLTAATQLQGPRRYRAYQALDADLTREAAPGAALYNETEQSFFSARIGCQTYQPVYGVDLAALCLKHRH
jgi:YVTN family beta-propeller protein